LVDWNSRRAAEIVAATPSGVMTGFVVVLDEAKNGRLEFCVYILVDFLSYIMYSEVDY